MEPFYVTVLHLNDKLTTDLKRDIQLSDRH